VSTIDLNVKHKTSRDRRCSVLYRYMCDSIGDRDTHRCITIHTARYDTHYRDTQRQTIAVEKNSTLAVSE